MIDRYVQSLRLALGDRLPPGVTTARLREARGHLEMAASEVGAEEAVRRYGSARRVANEMVRVHRGYATASSWRLALPLGLMSILTPMVSLTLLGLFGSSLLPFVNALLRCISLATVGLFFFRSIQTRRWLAVPMIAWHLPGLLIAIAFSVWNLRQSTSSSDIEQRSLFLLESSAQTVLLTVLSWTLNNGLALGAGALFDRRNVRNG